MKWILEISRMRNSVVYTIVFLGFGVLIFSCSKIENFTEIATPRYTGNYANSPTDSPEALKVVTFNIEFANKIDEAIEELQTSLDLKDADIISLQEMDEVGTEKIAKSLAYNYVYYPSNVNPDGSLFGIAILTKWPIIEDEKILLPHEKPINGRKNIAMTTEIIVGNQNVRVYNIHAATFILPKAKRRDQYHALISHIQQLDATQEQDHVLIAGDFNTDKSNDIEYLVELCDVEGLQWTSEDVGPTYQTLSGLSKFTLDHFFIRGFDLIEAGKPKETKASDHLPMWMDIKM